MRAPACPLPKEGRMVNQVPNQETITIPHHNDKKTVQKQEN